VSNISQINGLSTSDILKKKSLDSVNDGGSGFVDQLKSAMNGVNEEQIKSENAMADMATGQVKDLHQAALAIGKAEVSMKLMLEVRSKALSAYQEISKTQM
jgi:flagellar hook-basal body complex protein FliE